MKMQVIKQVQIPTLDPTDVRSDKYYGIIPKEGGDKGFVSASPYQGEFTILFVDSLTTGKSFAICESYATLKELCTENQEHFTIFQFDTYKELFKWLAED